MSSQPSERHLALQLADDLQSYLKKATALLMSEEHERTR
jgi:hypothetical protein